VAAPRGEEQLLLDFAELYIRMHNMRMHTKAVDPLSGRAP
jgi:hypothetical protein